MPPGRNSDQALFPIEGAHLSVLPVNDHIPVSGAQSNEREAAQFLAVTAVTLSGGVRVCRSGLVCRQHSWERKGGLREGGILAHRSSRGKPRCDRKPEKTKAR